MGSRSLVIMDGIPGGGSQRRVWLRRVEACCHCRSGGGRELWPWPLPLRRQGEAGRGCSRFALIPKAPLPNPSGPPAQLACVRRRASQWLARAPPHPLPSQGWVQELRTTGEIGREEVREGVCQDISIPVVAVYIKKQKKHIPTNISI